MIPVLLVDLEDAPSPTYGLALRPAPVTSWPNRDRPGPTSPKASGAQSGPSIPALGDTAPTAPAAHREPNAVRAARAAVSGTAVASVPLPEKPVRTLEMARRRPDNRDRDARTDALLERTIAAFANRLALAAHQNVQGIGSGESGGPGPRR